jgi:thiamine biosynthesis lipoprotein
MTRIQRNPTLAIVLAALCLVVGCKRSGDNARVSRAREIMGTLATLTATARDEATAAAAVEAGYTRLEDVNRLMSDYVSDSEIGRLNALPVGERLSLSSETLRCLQRAIEVSQISGGAFDVTCRPLISLWKSAGRAGRLPADEALVQVRGLIGTDKIVLDVAAGTAARTADGVQVDLGGIAKGHALDLAGAAMRSAGAASALVDVGGDVLAVGVNQAGKPWRVGIKHPFRGGIYAVLELSDRAVATSGAQQRFYEIDGQRYSHIIDPRSGWPAGQAPSVTVIAADGITADAWATVFSVLTIDEGRRLIASGRVPELEVLWIAGPADAPVVERTDAFEKYMAD